VDRYQRIGAHGEMISSDLHGAEEPIRWSLGWQRQDKVMMSPCMEKKKDTLIRTFWQIFDLWGSTPADGMMALMDRTPPRTGWTFSGADGSVLGLFGTYGRLQEPQEGPTFCLLDDDDALKGPTSPSEGPDVSLLALF
jgi:hypothetical protein